MLSRYSSKEEPLEMELTSGLPETELFSGLTVTKVTSELPELPEKSPESWMGIGTVYSDSRLLQKLLWCYPLLWC